MSHLLDDDDDNLHGHQNHRELTLSTSSVLGIFFGLALSWALFFGFGYHMGNKAREAAQPTTADTSETTPSTANFSSFKPAPGSPAYQSSSSSNGSVPVNSGSGPIQSIPPSSTSSAETATAVAETPTDIPKPTPISLHPTQPAVPLSATGTFIVQVAAVSHQEDADLLVNALHGKGYSVSAHAEPQDKLIHIQVGPFNNRKDAEAMRQQLLSDGYNAIVK